MNENTKIALFEFAQEVVNFGYAVSSVSGTDALAQLVRKADMLMAALGKDETIP